MTLLFDTLRTVRTLCFSSNFLPPPHRRRLENQKSSLWKLEWIKRMTMFKKFAQTTKKTLAKGLFVMLLLGGSVHARPAPAKQTKGRFVVCENPFVLPHREGQIFAFWLIYAVWIKLLFPQYRCDADFCHLLTHSHTTHYLLLWLWLLLKKNRVSLCVRHKQWNRNL